MPQVEGTIPMEMRFFNQPVGLLNIDYLLERADSVLRRAKTHMDVSVELFFPVRLWKRIIEDADTRGMTPPQLVRHIVREHYARCTQLEDVYDDDE